MSEHVLEIPLNADVQRDWEGWIQVTRSRCHLHFELLGGNLGVHIARSMESAMSTARRLTADVGQSPRKILEVGCSTGFNCLALSSLFPGAEVHGIEPDDEAISVARSMAAAAGVDNVHFRQGVGEHLPYGAGEFDLIICLTVIEHVKDVECVINEMSRVLAPGGRLYLEAPNYLWPYEPHLNIWCIPLFGKRFASFMAVIQGKGKYRGYLGHLQFVTPGRLESAFRQNGLSWENRVKAKLEQALDGDVGQIKAYRRVVAVLGFLSKYGLSRWLVSLAMWSKLYPSVLYTVRKPRHD